MDRGEERRTANGWQSTVLESECTATALTCRPAAPFKRRQTTRLHIFIHAYFHDSLTPLTSAVLSALSTNDIQLHHDWMGVVGAVVGRDDAAIRAGVHNVLSAAGGHDAFLRRLQLDEMPIQTAMLLLRIYHCIQTVGLSSALQMWAPSWPSVCNTSVVGVHATAALCSASGYASEGGKKTRDECGTWMAADSVR